MVPLLSVWRLTQATAEVLGMSIASEPNLAGPTPTPKSGGWGDGQVARPEAAGPWRYAGELGGSEAPHPDTPHLRKSPFPRVARFSE